MNCFRTYRSQGKAKAPTTPPAKPVTHLTPKAARIAPPTLKAPSAFVKQMEEQVEAGRRAYTTRVQTMPSKADTVALGDLFNMSQDEKQAILLCSGQVGQRPLDVTFEHAKVVFFIPPKDGTARSNGSLRVLYDSSKINLEALAALKHTSMAYRRDLARGMQEPRLLSEIDPRFDFIWLLVFPRFLLKLAREGKGNDPLVEAKGRKCLSRLGYCHKDPNKAFIIVSPSAVEPSTSPRCQDNAFGGLPLGTALLARSRAAPTSELRSITE